MKILINESQIKRILDTIILAEEKNLSKSPSRREIIAGFIGKNCESEEKVKINKGIGESSQDIMPEGNLRYGFSNF